jgi:transglutaminase-like putative cysteine protease
MPRLPGTLVRAMPFRLSPTQTGAPPGDHIENPALAAPPDGSVVDFSAAGYPGFSDAMDLRARGALSNEIAFRVRAPFASLWRAEVFDTFDGTVWTRSGSPLEALRTTDDGGVQMPPTVDPAWGGRPLVQTFFIDQPQPNVLFAAGAPHIVYFPAGGLRTDRDQSIRSPIFLDEGLVYSVESIVPDVGPAELALVGMRQHPGRGRYVRRYLQLPAELPQRVRDLAAQITSGTRGEYEAVMAVQTWLQTNTRYDLTVPREPDGVDAVDHFLFETRRGFCEHIASAMAVLLRAEGIPTRIVTGYGPGERNPFTGYYEVRNADAHAWLEVYYPRVGWIAYDPTFGVPAVPDGWGTPVGADLLAWAGRHLAATVPAGMRAGAVSAIRSALDAGRGLIHSWAVALVALLAVAGVAVVRRRRAARPAPPPDAIGAAFEELVATLAAGGLAPDPARTPSELRETVAMAPAFAGETARQVAVVVDTFERARYARPQARPTAADVVRARTAVARVRELTHHR